MLITLLTGVCNVTILLLTTTCNNKVNMHLSIIDYLHKTWWLHTYVCEHRNQPSLRQTAWVFVYEKVLSLFFIRCINCFSHRNVIEHVEKFNMCTLLHTYSYYHISSNCTTTSNSTAVLLFKHKQPFMIAFNCNKL